MLSHDFSVINRPTHIYIMWNVEKSIRLLLCEPFFFSVILFLFFSGRESNIKMTNCIWSLIYGFHRLHSFFFHSRSCSLKLITSSWNVKSRVLNDHTNNGNNYYYKTKPENEIMQQCSECMAPLCMHANISFLKKIKIKNKNHY